MRRLLAGAAGVAAASLLMATGAASQHGTANGHLLGTGAFGKVVLVARLDVHDAAPGIVSDVGALGNFAYLGKFAQDSCAGPEGQVTDGGVYVIDIANPARPREVGFIPAHQDTFVGEGVQALHIDTPGFSGDILVQNNEGCGKNFKAGASVWDITNPLKPMKLFENFGDFTRDEEKNTPHDANQIHSAFAWDAGDRAFIVMVDDEESRDVDLLEITDPKHPVLIAETGLGDWPAAQSPLALGNDAFFHDVVVKRIGGHWLMLLSYWDAGWVVLDVDDPAHPVFVNDFDYPNPDPLSGLPPEGNAHEAEWSFDNQFILGTDEDIELWQTTFRITSGPSQGVFPSEFFSWTFPIDHLSDGVLNGPTVYGGYGCPDDVGQIPARSVLGPLAPGEEAILVIQRGPAGDPNHPHAACLFSEKIVAAQDAGYDAVIIANHHPGSGAGRFPDAPPFHGCGGQGSRFTSTIPAGCIGHRGLHVLFGTTPTFAVPYAAIGTPAYTEPAVGALGARVEMRAAFDGWGGVHLIEAATLQQLDAFVIPEALDTDNVLHFLACNIDFCALSVHEVATDPDANLGYLAYYGGGFRAIKFSRTGGIEQIGGYLDPQGNNFWGVQVWRQPGTGQKFVLASDRDSGLWIFRLKR